MKTIKAAFCLLLSLGFPAAAAAQEEISFVVDPLPDEIQAKVEFRNWEIPYYLPDDWQARNRDFLVRLSHQWLPGETVRVGFHPSTTEELRRAIIDTAGDWLRQANLDLRLQDDQGIAYEWSDGDQNYQAEIRVVTGSAAEVGGSWSVIGLASVDAAIRPPNTPSMSLANLELPLDDWDRAKILHEFGHAFGLLHEHQNPLGGCDLAFRWKTDFGYRLTLLPTRDGTLALGPDLDSRSPGMLRFFNFLGRSESQVRADLLMSTESYIEYSGFDPLSIMKYGLPRFLCKPQDSSGCCTEPNLTLSEGDLTAMETIYPASSTAACERIVQRREYYQILTSSPDIGENLADFIAYRLPLVEQAIQEYGCE